jgi:hypothetical protein
MQRCNTTPKGVDTNTGLGNHTGQISSYKKKPDGAVCHVERIEAPV